MPFCYLLTLPLLLPLIPWPDNSSLDAEYHRHEKLRDDDSHGDVKNHFLVDAHYFFPRFRDFPPSIGFDGRNRPVLDERLGSTDGMRDFPLFPRPLPRPLPLPRTCGMFISLEVRS